MNSSNGSFDPNFFQYYQDTDGGTLLFNAAEYKYSHFCDALLSDGHDCLVKSKYIKRSNKSPYEIATSKGNTNVVNTMEKYIGTKNSNNSSANNSNRKQIEDAYLKYRNSIEFSKFFLLSLNFSKIESNEKNRMRIDKYQCHMAPSQFDGILSVVSGVENGKEGTLIMNKIVATVMLLLSKKSVVSEDLLVLCFEYCKMVKEQYNDSSMFDKFVQILKDTVVDCLDSTKKYGAIDVNFHTKSFKYHWFKQFLLKSNIWLSKYNDNDSKDNKDTNDRHGITDEKLLYYEIAKQAIEKPLRNQKEFIWNNVEKEEKFDKDSWNEILTFGSEREDIIKLRQDSIEHGIVSTLNTANVYTLLPIVNVNDFDIFNEANNKIYLTQCLIFAHKMNMIFQNDVENIFSNIYKRYKADCNKRNIDVDSAESIYRCASAPVKLYQRCCEKSSTDYRNEQFPSAGSIVDFVRCSITFATSKDMLYFLKQFIDTVNNNNNEDNNDESCIFKVVRIKNGFANVLKWKDINDATYCDIKLIDKTTPMTQMVWIYFLCTNVSHVFWCNVLLFLVYSGEVQFLQKWLLKAKKIGHKLYSVVRRQEFIDCICDMMQDDTNYNHYRLKIQSLIKSENINYLIKEMVWRPNVVSISQPLREIRNHEESGGYGFNNENNCNDNRFKLNKLYLGSLLHFSYNILNMEKNGAIFFENYFNRIEIAYDTKDFMGFRGLHKDKYTTLEYFLNNKYYNGITEYKKISSWKSCQLLYRCCYFNDFEYAKLLVKYKDKCKLIIDKGVNYSYSDSSKQEYPLLIIINSKRGACQDRWFKFLLIK